MTPADPEQVWLLDGNVLVALADTEHVHHQPARSWFAQRPFPFATCPITQGTLLRMLVLTRAVPNPAAAAQVLTKFTAHPRHRFWPAVLAYSEVSWKGVLGHRQITDAYLIALAHKRGGRLATFDRGLAALHQDIAFLIAS